MNEEIKVWCEECRGMGSRAPMRAICQHCKGKGYTLMPVPATHPMFARIAEELELAKAKHPKVCRYNHLSFQKDLSKDQARDIIHDALSEARRRADKGFADGVLCEEVYESYLAILDEDKDAIRTELAQVCVVAIRATDHFAPEGGV